jgi:hypothetical protein
VTSRRLPAQTPPRVIHYVDASASAAKPAYRNPAGLAYPLSPGQQAARRDAYRRRYLLWKAEQEATAARDRQLRRFWLGFGAVFALGLLAGLAVAGWFIWHALAALSIGALAIPVVLALAALIGVGGQKCITVVQHWH